LEKKNKSSFMLKIIKHFEVTRKVIIAGCKTIEENNMQDAQNSKGVEERH